MFPVEDLLGEQDGQLLDWRARGDVAYGRCLFRVLLLLVSLDRRRGANLCLVRIEPGRSSSSSLPEQTPALIERNLELT